MFKTATIWNLSRPDLDIVAELSNIKLRGYEKDTYLTGQFRLKLRDRIIRPLAVSDIADRYCPKGREIYFKKGVKRLGSGQLNKAQIKTWQQKAGNTVDSFIQDVTRLVSSGGSRRSYKTVRREADKLFLDFTRRNKAKIQSMINLERDVSTIKEGDTDWLLKLLRNTGNLEIGMNVLNSRLKQVGSLDPRHIRIKEEIKPNSLQIGISTGVTPDFIAPTFRIVGDIKTGTEFKSRFQLTCAGYALAFESAHGQGNDINWGIIYFVPTRNPTAYVRPFTFAQLYIFPIDDSLRSWFINERDDTYNIISGEDVPEFPGPEKRDRCKDCRFINYCQSCGLEL